MNNTSSIKRVTSILFVLRILRMSMSVVTLIFSAKYFGVSIERDVWILVTTFLVTVCSAVWGPINETFRAKFIFIREQEGEQIALRKTVSLMGFIVAITVLISICILISLHLITSVIVQHPTDESSKLFMSLLLIMLPTFLMNELINIGISILNAYEVYYVPEIVGAVSSFLNIIIIICLAPVWGIYSLAVSQYIALILLLLMVFYKVRRLHIFQLSMLLHIQYKYVKVFLMFALPFFFPYFVGQCNLLAEKWLAGLLGEGNISSLDYARQFTVVLQSVLSSILVTVMVPMLAKSYAKNDSSGFNKIISENLIVCFAILAIVIPLLYGAAQPLCEFFFLRGKVSPEALQTIVSLTRMYAVAFVGIILYLLFGGTLLASNKGKQYAWCGVLAQLLVLAINFLLIDYCSIYIFPVSVGIAHLASAIIMSQLLKNDYIKVFYVKILRYSSIIFLLTSCIYALNQAVRVSAIPIVQLIVSVLLLIPLFILASKSMDLDIKRYVIQILQKKK